MTDIAKFAKLLAESGFSPEDYKSVFENIGSTSSSASAAGGSSSKTVNKVSKKEADAASVPGSDPASPSRMSSQYKVKLRVIIAERHGVKTKVDQDKILDKFNKEWLKAKYPENYHEFMKYTESVAKEFIAEMFPTKASDEKPEEEEEEEQVCKKTIDIEGKPTTVWYNESNGNVYNDKEELIGKLNKDDKFTPN